MSVNSLSVWNNVAQDLRSFTIFSTDSGDRLTILKGFSFLKYIICARTIFFFSLSKVVGNNERVLDSAWSVNFHKSCRDITVLSGSGGNLGRLVTNANAKIKMSPPLSACYQNGSTWFDRLAGASVDRIYPLWRCTTPHLLASWR